MDAATRQASYKGVAVDRSQLLALGFAMILTSMVEETLRRREMTRLTMLRGQVARF